MAESKKSCKSGSVLRLCFFEKVVQPVVYIFYLNGLRAQKLVQFVFWKFEPELIHPQHGSGMKLWWDVGGYKMLFEILVVVRRNVYGRCVEKDSHAHPLPSGHAFLSFWSFAQLDESSLAWETVGAQVGRLQLNV